MKKILLISTLICGAPLFAQNNNASCMAACASNIASQFCLALPRDAKLATSFKSIHAELVKPSATNISKTHLMALFAVKDDPCQRSDTSGRNGMWENNGLGCILNAEISFLSGAKKVKTEIHIPQQLKFSVANVSGWTEIKPQSSTSILKISDKYLHNDWGGVIERIYANQSAVMFQMPRGCIKINL